MADEIKVSVKLEAVNGDFKFSRTSGIVKADQAAAGVQASVQNIGTSYEVLDLGNVTTEGYAFFRNIDVTNFIVLGPTGTAVIKLLPGEVALFRIDSSISLFAQADTAACDLEYAILQA